MMKTYIICFIMSSMFQSSIQKTQCVNVESNDLCVKFAQRGYCQSFSIWMEENCARTCGTCNKAISVSSVKIVPIWAQWEGWSACSATCGLAHRLRQRKCLTDSDSLQCPGSDTENKKCENLPLCSGWSVWKSWGSCSATCGLGSYQVRTRTCKSGNAINCPGRKSETKLCNVPTCQVYREPVLRSALICVDLHSSCGEYVQRKFCTNVGYKAWMEHNCKLSCGICGFSDWSSWSTCTATCDGGDQKRFRTCIVSNVKCQGITSQTQKCSTNLCPKFGNWATWGSCDATCGSGIQSRSRLCLNGPGCVGSSMEKQSCPNLAACPVVTEWSLWGSWGSCSATCDQGQITRTRLCKNGPGCPGENTGAEKETQNCVVTKCPQFLEWGQWGTCDATCGAGSQIRTRICESNLKCSGNWEESRPCQTQTCAFFGEWSNWGTCSVSCGDGTHVRTRPCLNGLNCVGNSTETQKCKGTHCMQMSQWSNWTTCSTTCGNGTKIRARRCMYGPGCTGATEEILPCNPSPCPMKNNCTDQRSDCSRFLSYCGIGRMMDQLCAKTCSVCVECNCFSDWTAWAPCSKSCNGGSTFRTRKCAESLLACEKEVKTCNDFICPGTFWGVWSPCTKTCGGGTKSKTMQCTEGYSKCSTFYQECSTQPCPSKICPLGEVQRYGDDSSCCKPTLGGTCGKSGGSGRIIGGQKADSRRWPWIVYMFMKNALGDEAICGGTLISTGYLVTAGHCVRDFQGKDDISLTMGFTTLGDNSKNVQRRRVSQVIIHPQFKMPSNDIAIIKMDKPVVVTDYVTPICLPSGEKTKVGKHCYAAGWGLTNPTSDVASTHLNEVALRVLDSKVCNTAYGASIYGKGMNYAMMCAGKISGGVDTCAGDSGGPLMCQRCSSCSWYLAAVTSFGSDNCGLANHPGVYTDVIEYEPWIRSIVSSIPNGSYTGCL